MSTARITRSSVRVATSNATTAAGRKRSSASKGSPLGEAEAQSAGNEQNARAEAQTDADGLDIPKSKKRKTAKAPAPPLTPPGPNRTLVPLGIEPTPLLPAALIFDVPTAIAHLSKADPRFGRMFDSLPCKPFKPPLDAIDPFKTLVTSIIGQQVSWMAARAINNRFMALFGFGDGTGSQEVKGYPSPGMVAGTDVMVLKGVGLSLRKAEYVKSLAEHFVSGELSTDLLKDGSDEEIAKALIAVRGIGQWTVDMFLMFSLRRPDVLPVGDLGVQKGMLKWALAAHDALPQAKVKEGKKADACKAKYRKKEVVKDEVDSQGNGELDTRICTPPPEDRNGDAPPTPFTPSSEIKPAVLHTPVAPAPRGIQVAPPTPITPGRGGATVAAEVLEVPAKELPAPAPEQLLGSMPEHPDWSAQRAAPLGEGIDIEMLRSRLSGKKAKGGAYLTPKEMEILTEGWRPYRSLAVYYMWPAGEDF